MARTLALFFILLLAACGTTSSPAPGPVLREGPTGAQARAAIHDRIVMNEFAAYRSEFRDFPPDRGGNNRVTVYEFPDGTLSIWWKPNKLDRFATLENVTFVPKR